MHVQSPCLALLCAGAVEAFRDTSPFFAFSTSSLPGLDSQPRAHLQKSSAITASMLHAVQDCPSNVYVLVSQPDVTIEDFADKDATRHLRHRVQRKNDAVKSATIIPEVFGTLDVERIQSYLRETCRASVMDVDATSYRFSSNDSYPQILMVDFPSLPLLPAERRTKLAQHDSFLAAIVDSLPIDYTVLLATTPIPTSDQLQDGSSYDYDLERPVRDGFHADLKRSLHSRALSNNSNATYSNSSMAPLFEKYNFFSPGIFMGLIAVILLLSILYVGLNAVSSLEVSYGAFAREMNPNAQKKQQ